MYLHPSVSTDKVLSMLKKLKEVDTEIHQFSLYHKDEKLVEFAPAPYSCQDKRRVNSVSKTFTSTAVGLCYDKGLLKPEDKLISFFPEELTKDADEKIKALTLHDLLTMCTASEDILPSLVNEPDILHQYFTRKHQPMTKEFHYNNSATYMLSAVVGRVTGGTMFDLLQKELFPVLGISGTSWPTLDGVTEGAAGLRVSADDIAKLMQIYLGKGVYQGKRLLSEEWVEMATSVQISTQFDNPYEWWTKGYGYQIWRNKVDGYRACGAIGQYGYVFPSLEMVLGEEAIVGKSDETDDIYYEFCSDYAGESTVSAEELQHYLDTMYQPLGGDLSSFAGFDRVAQLEKNPMGFTLAVLRNCGDTVEMELSEGEFAQVLRFGVGHWEENKLFAHHFRPELYSLTIPRREIVHFAASCTVNAEGALEVLLRFRDCAFRYNMVVTTGEPMTIHFDTPSLLPDANHITGHFISK